MIYLPETYYFRNNKVTYSPAALITAQALLKYSTGFKAQLTVPLKSVKEKIKEGHFPTGAKKKKVLLDILSWLKNNSLFENTFSLRMYRTYPPGKNEMPVFQYHDDGCCWFLDINPKEFRGLQQVWKQNSLPKDLFYPENKKICVPSRFFFGMLKGNRCYSPKEWEARGKK